jgi:bifunctional DNase/RNase
VEGPERYNQRIRGEVRRSSGVLREFAMPVQMQLARIIISEISDQQFIYLKEVEGERQFPIVIGIFEATSIDRRVKHFPSPRPLTHDLVCNVVDSLGGELDSVVISELKDHIYFARLRIKREGELIEVDCRPSDAIAVAVSCDPHLPIFVAEDVLEELHEEQEDDDADDATEGDDE